MDEKERMEDAGFAEMLNGLEAKERETVLWDKIASLQGETFKTSGRGVREGVSFTYSVKRDKRRTGRR